MPTEVNGVLIVFLGQLINRIFQLSFLRWTGQKSTDHRKSEVGPTLPHGRLGVVHGISPFGSRPLTSSVEINRVEPGFRSILCIFLGLTAAHLLRGPFVDGDDLSVHGHYGPKASTRKQFANAASDPSGAKRDSSALGNWSGLTGGNNRPDNRR